MGVKPVAQTRTVCKTVDSSTATMPNGPQQARKVSGTKRICISVSNDGKVTFSLWLK